MNGTSLANQSFNKNPLLIKHALYCVKINSNIDMSVCSIFDRPVVNYNVTENVCMSMRF